MKHIVSFSGGASSSYCAWLVAQKEKKQDIILLYAETGAEHPDADRFRKEVAEYLKLPITTVSCGYTLWELIDKNKMIPSMFFPFCTTTLKIKPMNKFYKTLNDNFIVYLGYGQEEWRRIQKREVRLKQDGVKSEYPCFKCGKSNEQIKDIIQNEWKIQLPVTYKHLKHNNCIPCFKAGKRDFIKYIKFYPEQIEKEIQKEKQTGYTVFEDYSLEQFRKDVVNQVEMFCEEDSVIPCECVE